MVMERKHHGSKETDCTLKVNKMNFKRIIILAFFPFSLFGQSVKEAYFEFDRFEYAKSIDIFEAVQKEKKLASNDFFLLSYAYYMTGDYTKCLTVLDELIASEKHESFHYRMKGDALKQLKKYDEAIAEYKKFGEAEFMDLVEFDIASCNYLKNTNETKNAVQSKFDFNTRKADALYFEQQFGWIRFQEMGFDSLKSSLDVNPADDAELMLMRPYVEFNNQWSRVKFPEEFSEAGISSFSKDPLSNQVVFTMTELLAKDLKKHYPHLYVGEYNKETNEVTNVQLFQYGELTDSTSTAFGVFEPTTGNLVFGRIVSGADAQSDFYFTKRNETSWTTPQLLTSVNTSGDEMYAHFKNDEIHFSSAGRYGYGNLDCYAAKFDPSTMTASEVTHFPKIINSENDDYWYYNNYDTITITSNRIGSNAEDDVWKILDQDKIDKRIRDQEIQDSLAKVKALEEILAWNPPYVYFEFRTNNPNSDYSFMDKLSQILNENPSISVVVEGNTDIRGEVEDNVWLSQTRANFVTEQLIKRGVPKERIKAVGKGEDLAKTNSTDKSSEEVHQQNRVSIIKLVTSFQ
jgi:outer membrane protein OmpA-like peptidoglycan-associated protein